MDATQKRSRQSRFGGTDFAAIQDDLECIKGQLAGIPTRKDHARTALGIIFCTVVFVVFGIGVFFQ